MRKGIMIFAMGILMAAHPALAQDADPEPLVVTVQNVTAIDAAREDVAGAVRSGDVLEYRLTFTNVRDADAIGVRFSDPIPEGLVYVLGSATADRGDVLVEYSLDAGESWSTSPEVEVVEDGQVVSRPAPAETYTTIRWTLSDPVGPGAQVTASFRAEARVGTQEAR